MFLKNLKINNFGRYENAELLNLNKNFAYLISGENKDVGGGNGVGKSMLLESLAWCLYGESLRPALKDVKKFIRRGEDKMNVEVSLHENLIFSRKRTMLKEEVEVYDQDGNQILEKRTKTIQKDYINDIITSFNMFKYLNYFNTQSLEFFALTPKQKYQLLEEILNLEELSTLMDEYKNNEKKLSVELSNLKFKETNNSHEIEKYLIQLNHNKETNDNIDNIINMKRDFILQNLNHILSSIRNNKENTKRSFNSLKEYNNELSELLNTALLNNEEMKPLTRNDEINLRNQLMKLKNVNKTIEQYLQNPGFCPLCKREYDFNITQYIINETKLNILSHDELVEHIKYIHENIQQNEYVVSIYEQKNDLEKKINNLKNDMITTNKRFQNEFEHYSNIFKNEETWFLYLIFSQEFTDTINIIKDELNNSLKLLSVLNISHDDIITFLNMMIILESEDQQIMYRNELRNIYMKNIVSIDVSEINKKIQFLTNENNNIQTKFSHFNNIYEKVGIVLSELTWNGDFRKNIIEQYLEKLEKTYNFFITKLIPTYKLKFKLEQTGKDKGINIIVYDDDDICGYGELSSGEKRMVDICLLLTLASYANGLIILDEALDNLSYENQIKIIEMLIELNRQVFIVSHNRTLLDNLSYENQNVKRIHIIRENKLSIIQLL